MRGSEGDRVRGERVMEKRWGRKVQWSWIEAFLSILGDGGGGSG